MAFFSAVSGLEYLKTFPSNKEMSGYLPEKKREKKVRERKKRKFKKKEERKWKKIEKKSKDSNLYTNRHRHGHIETALR